MNLPLPIRLAAFLVAIAPLNVLRAEVLTILPGNVSASTELVGFPRTVDHIVDGSGLSGGQHNNGANNVTWLSGGACCGSTIDLNPWVEFDLGAVYTINSFHVWNYNEAAGGGLHTRGVRDVTIHYGTTAALGSTVPGITQFAQADGLNTYSGEDFSGFAPFSAQFIRFEIANGINVGNWGDTNTFYGLSEVQFDGTASGLAVSPNDFVTSASQGAAVGTLTTPSGDAGDTFTYTLIAGTGDTDNSKFQIVGDELQIGLHDFSGAAEGEEFSVRVLSTGAPSGATVEAALTLSAVADSDGDGLLDAWEELWAGVGNLGVLSGLADANADGDTLTDLDEYNLRDQFPNLDPTNADSDGDTLDDGDEIAGAGLRPATDPTNADTDGDTLSDGVETNTGIFVGPTDTGTDPTQIDTDGDTFNDGAEVARGGDPTDANSTPPVTLVGYWPFEASADPQPDLSGFANDAAVFPGATWVDDPERGGVMEFDGNDSYLEAADSVSLSLTGDITIAAWVKVTDFFGYRGIVAKSAGPNGNLPASYDLYLVQNNGRARFYSGSPNGFAQVTATTVPVTGEWHHIAVTRIGDEVSFYYDGQLDGQGATTREMLDSEATLRIGNRTDLVTDFFGRMDEVAIFDGGLSSLQIMEVMGGDFSAFGVSGSGGDPLALRVRGNGADLVFEWKSQAGMRYNLRSVLDPSSSDPKDWPIYDGLMEIAATPDTNTLTIARPADALRFFVIEEFPAPPVTIFSENFDGADPGWATGFEALDPLMNTVWQLGDPSGGPATGPQAPNSVPNCYGTNLAANYGVSSNTWLRTPAIDLSTASAATVVFQQWLDMDDFDNLDSGSLRVLDASVLPGTVTELGVVEANITGFVNGWAEFSAELPAAALGQVISLEFGFRSDGDDIFDAAGWYIDDVVVTIPGS